MYLASKCYGVGDYDYGGLIAIDTISDLPNSSQQVTLELLTCPHNLLVQTTTVGHDNIHLHIPLL